MVSKKKARNIKEFFDQYKKIIIASFAVAVLFIGTFIFSGGDIGVIGNVIVITILALVSPYLFISYLKFARIREIEERFPQFLRDIADSVKSGYSLPQAIKASSNTDYGRLTTEVKKMSNQLSWGVSFPRTIELFMQRLKSSSVITRSMTILLEAYNAGGNIAPILNSAADSVVTIKEAEYEKKSLLKEHVMMMYAIFFVFIGIVLALTGILLPILNLTTSNSNAAGGSGFSAALKGGNPCDVAKGFQITLCNFFEGVGHAMGFGTGIKAYYKALFFVMIMVQALFSGLVAGEIGEDSLKAGAKHAMIMIGSGFAIYIIAIKLGFV